MNKSLATKRHNKKQFQDAKPSKRSRVKLRNYANDFGNSTKRKVLQNPPSTFCHLNVQCFATRNLPHHPPFSPIRTAGLEIIAREGAEEYSRILPEVLPSGAVVEEQEIKGNLGAKVM